MRDFINSRVIQGRQQIKAAISFHSYSELVLWPYGYTTSTTPDDMDPTDYQVFSTMGKKMASMNGYTPMQVSSLYVADGSWDDWVYGVHKIFGFTFEMSPTDNGSDGFYPSGAKVEAYVKRNREPVIYFLQQADCPYKTVGKTC